MKIKWNAYYFTTSLPAALALPTAVDAFPYKNNKDIDEDMYKTDDEEI